MNEMNGKERSETRRGETGHLFLLSVAIDDPEGREGEKKGRFPFASLTHSSSLRHSG